jgi:hypothetical protein
VHPDSNVGGVPLAHLTVLGNDTVVPALLVVNSTKYSFNILLFETLPNLIVNVDSEVLVFL